MAPGSSSVLLEVLMASVFHSGCGHVMTHHSPWAPHSLSLSASVSSTVWMPTLYHSLCLGTVVKLKMNSVEVQETDV